MTNKSKTQFVRAILILAVLCAVAPAALGQIEPASVPSGYVGSAYPSTQLSVFNATATYSFSVISTTGCTTGLPPGLNLTSGGLLSGTPTQAGNFCFTVFAQGSGGDPNQQQNYNVTIYAALVITNPTLPQGVVGVSYSASIQVSGGLPPYGFDTVGGTLPPGLNFDYEGGGLSGTPTTAGTYTFGVFVIDGNDKSITQNVSVTINPPLSITTTFVPDGSTGYPYSAQVVATGGVAPRTFAVISGSLPPGLSLNPSTGWITGTPTVSNFYPFTVRVTDQLGLTASQGFYIYVNLSLLVTTDTLPSGTVNEPYTGTLTSTYPPSGQVWSIYSGALPPGLSLNPSTGVISGTPTSAGTYDFAVTVYVQEETNYAQKPGATRAAGGGLFATSPPKSLRIIIGYPPMDFSPTTLEPGNVSVPYLAKFTPTGGDGTYEIILLSGALPPGLTYNKATWTISGTPTTEGTFRFVMRGSSGNSFLDRQYQIAVGPPKLSVLPITLPNAYKGDNYSAQLSAGAGTGPFTFALTGGQLPNGVTMTAAGAISGVPTIAGIFRPTIEVKDASGAAASRTYEITIYDTLSLGPAEMPDGIINEAYLAPLIVTGGRTPYTYALIGGALPAGLTLASNGLVSGTPTATGTFTFNARVIDGGERTAEREIRIVIGQPLQLLPATLPPATLFLTYGVQLQGTGGRAPYTFTLQGQLPPGMSFSNGQFGGAPTQPGDYPLTARVTDASQRQVSRNYVLVVPRGITILTASLPAGVAGSPYALTFEASGGRPPYTWSNTGALPSGLSINATTGALTGTPAQSGAFPVTVKVQDPDGLVGMREYTLTITRPNLPPVLITDLPPTSPPGQQPGFNVKLNAPYPLPINGVITLTFAPDAGPDDPAVQFANGRRTLNYVIPAGTMTGQFESTPALQTGTVAGLITLVTRYTVEGVNVTPDPPPTEKVRVNASAPVLTSLKLTRTTSGFELEIIGYSSTRQVNQATVGFTAAAGGNLGTSTVSVPLSSVFQAWYDSAASAPFGSQFKLVIPFTINGETAALASVAVSLSNSAGNSNTLSANY